MILKTFLFQFLPCLSYLSQKKDTTVKFWPKNLLCPTAESAICAEYFLNVQMNHPRYCYPKRKASLAILSYQAGKSSGHELPRPAGARNAGERMHLAPGREGTRGRFWTTPLWLMPEAVLTCLWNKSHPALLSWRVTVACGFGEYLYERGSKSRRRGIDLGFIKDENRVFLHFNSREAQGTNWRSEATL